MSQPEWSQFEQQVAATYQSLGYRVSPNRHLDGNQIDFIAVKEIAGLGLEKVAVECKFSEKNLIRKEVVHAWRNVAEALLVDKSITKAVLVTNRGFSPASFHAIAKNEGLALYTLEQLEKVIFRNTSALFDYCKHYDGRAIARNYVPFKGNMCGYDRPELEQPVSDVELLAIETFSLPPPSLVTVLADFGAGKSTLVERLKYKLAQKFLEKHIGPRPIIFPLKEYIRSLNLDRFITWVLSKEFGNEVQLSAFWDCARRGEFVILIDGFDEMIVRSDEQHRRSQLLELSPLICCGSHCLLTCRSAYFVSAAEYRLALAEIAGLKLSQTYETSQYALSDRSRLARRLKQELDERVLKNESIPVIDTQRTIVVRLSTFDEGQIKDYLIKWNERFIEKLNVNWKAVSEFLLRVYDLSQLAERPILLEMICVTVLQGSIDLNNKKIKIGATSLYEIYTSSQFERDCRKGLSRQGISMENRQIFAEAIAVAMNRRSVWEVENHEIPAIANEQINGMDALRNLLRENTLDQIVNDIRTCSFLSRTPDEKFRFAHKSFMEYFVAHWLYRRYKAGDTSRLKSESFSREILGFFGGFGFHDKGFVEFLSSEIDEQRISELHRRNLFGALCASGERVGHLRLTGGTFEQLLVCRCELFHASFNAIVLKNVLFKDVSFASTSLLNLVLQACDFDNCNFHHGKLENLRVSTGSLEDCKFDDVDVEMTCDNVLARRLIVTGSIFSMLGNYVVSDLRLKRSEVTFSRAADKVAEVNDVTAVNHSKVYFRSGIVARRIKAEHAHLFFENGTSIHAGTMSHSVIELESTSKSSTTMHTGLKCVDGAIICAGPVNRNSASAFGMDCEFRSMAIVGAVLTREVLSCKVDESCFGIVFVEGSSRGIGIPGPSPDISIRGDLIVIEVAAAVSLAVLKKNIFALSVRWEKRWDENTDHVRRHFESALLTLLDR